jgi:hypothetical protein
MRLSFSHFERLFSGWIGHIYLKGGIQTLIFIYFLQSSIHLSLIYKPLKASFTAALIFDIFTLK